MTENQVTKLKGRLLNIQTQLNGASILLSKGEPVMNAKVQEANKIVNELFTMCDSIKIVEEPQPKPKKKKVYSALVPHEVIIARHELPTYNLMCRNYSEIRNRKNEVIERTCVIGMDLCYCSKKCAYATNNVCSLRG